MYSCCRHPKLIRADVGRSTEFDKWLEWEGMEARNPEEVICGPRSKREPQVEVAQWEEKRGEDKTH